MSNSLDPDKAPPYVGADLGPNCLQKLSEDGTSWQRVQKMNNMNKEGLFLIVAQNSYQ